MSKKIIVIEYDNDILDIMKYILEEEGYIVSAYKQEESLLAIAKEKPQLILLDDDQLSIGSGHGLCSRIKANPYTHEIPVILVSAVLDLAKVAKNCNADSYLPKPFDLDDFVTLVKQYA